MRRRVVTAWSAYGALVLVGLVSVVVAAVNRVGTSSLGSSAGLTLGAVILGGGLLATVVVTGVWGLQNFRCRAALHRRYPDAEVLTARRDDFRDLIDVDALGIRYQDIPYFVGVVVDESGISAWAGGDPGEAPRMLALLPWSKLGPLERSATESALPRYVLRSEVNTGDGVVALQLSLSSAWSGGLLPQGYRASGETLAALEAVRGRPASPRRQ